MENTIGPVRVLRAVGAVLVLATTVVMAGSLFLGSAASGAAGEPAGGGAEDAGRALFLSSKCDLCHALSSEGIEARAKSEKMRGPDLSVVEARDAEWTARYLRKLETLDGEEHKKGFAGSDEDLAKLIEWLGQYAAGAE